MPTELERLRRELHDIKHGVVTHRHVPLDGNEFSCTSPYCEDLTAPEPRGAPPFYADDPRYKRED